MTTKNIPPYLRLSGLEPLVVRPETNFVNLRSQLLDENDRQDKRIY